MIQDITPFSPLDERPTHAERLIAAAKSGALGKAQEGHLRVMVAREPFADYFTLIIDDEQGGFHTEEMDDWSLIDWMMARGFTEDATFKAKDQAWNFGKAVAETSTPKKVKQPVDPLAPKINR